MVRVCVDVNECESEYDCESISLSLIQTSIFFFKIPSSIVSRSRLLLVPILQRKIALKLSSLQLSSQVFEKHGLLTSSPLRCSAASASLWHLRWALAVQQVSLQLFSASRQTHGRDVKRWRVTRAWKSKITIWLIISSSEALPKYSTPRKLFLARN